MENEKLVYKAINAIAADLAHEGIAKSKKNQQQNYAFRGIDDVYQALAPLLAKHQLCLLPRVLNRLVTERQTKAGGVLFYVVVEVEYSLVSAIDGSEHKIVTMGEAMDSGDKATNKAMSAAYKYACLQSFCIPVEGQEDADATTPPEVKPDAKANDAERKRLLQEVSTLYKQIAEPSDKMTAWVEGSPKLQTHEIRNGILLLKNMIKKQGAQ